MESNNGEKYFRCACIKARYVEISLLAAVYKRYIPKSKENTFQHNNLYKTVEITAKKYNSVLTIPNMVLLHGRVHISFMLI